MYSLWAEGVCVSLPPMVGLCLICFCQIWSVEGRAQRLGGYEQVSRLAGRHTRLTRHTLKVPTYIQKSPMETKTYIRRVRQHLTRVQCSYSV